MNREQYLIGSSRVRSDGRTDGRRRALSTTWPYGCKCEAAVVSIPIGNGRNWWWGREQVVETGAINRFRSAVGRTASIPVISFDLINESSGSLRV